MPAIPTIIRWAARLSALVITGGFLLILAGDLSAPHSGPSPNTREWYGIILLALTCLGMLIAWRWELPGAGISLASLAAFTVLITFNRYTVHMVLAIPGLLFLADWLLRRDRRIPELPH